MASEVETEATDEVEAVDETALEEEAVEAEEPPEPPEPPAPSTPSSPDASEAAEAEEPTEPEEEVVEHLPYYQRVLNGEIAGPPFTHVGEDGTFTDYTLEEVVASSKSDIQKAAWLSMKVDNMKRELVDTDYIALKLAEGAATADEYADKITERQTLRTTINEYQDALDALNVEV